MFSMYDPENSKKMREVFEEDLTEDELVSRVLEINESPLILRQFKSEWKKRFI